MQTHACRRASGEAVGCSGERTFTRFPAEVDPPRLLPGLFCFLSASASARHRRPGCFFAIETDTTLSPVPSQPEWTGCRPRLGARAAAAWTSGLWQEAGMGLAESLVCPWCIPMPELKDRSQVPKDMTVFSAWGQGKLEPRNHSLTPAADPAWL